MHLSGYALFKRDDTTNLVYAVIKKHLDNQYSLLSIQMFSQEKVLIPEEGGEVDELEHVE